MPAKLSRRKIAETTARSVADGDQKALERLAAYLVDSKRTSEAQLIVRDTERELTAHGIVLVDVTSARKLNEAARTSITSFVQSDTGAKQVILREQIDPGVIGGVRVAYGDKLLDATVTAKLERLA